MTYHKYFFIIAVTAVISWLSWILVITQLDPCRGPGQFTICHSASGIALLLFFLSAFFALTATITLLGFGIRLWLHHYEIYLDHLNISLRQGILLALCALGAMGLLLLNSLTWWSGLLLVAIVTLLELYFTRAS